MFKKVLVANRGEIALRVIRACKELGIKTVAIHSEADANSLHARAADEHICVGPAEAALSYRNIPNVLSAAEVTGADAIHPGYGFLSENSEFARRCKQAGVVFIGPSPESMDAMASKSAAKALMEKAGVPDVKGVWLTVSGGSRLMMVVSIKQRYPGHAKQAAVIASQCHAGAYLGRFVVVVDDDIDPFDPMQVDWSLATRMQADKDVIIIPRIACSTLDPSVPEARVTAGLGIDATAPIKDHWRFEKVEIPGVDKVKYI